MESKSIRFARIAAFFSLRKVCFSFQKWLEALIQRKTSNHSRLLVFLLWQGMRDSNPRKRSQSPVCYRYTNPLNGLLPKRMIIITISRKKSRLIFSFLQKSCSLLLCAKELISSDALIFLRRNGGEAMKYECLKLEERRIIEEMYAKGAKPGEIAERVGKCQATIYRELERGKTGETDSRFRQGYSAAVAEARVNRSYRNRGRRKAAQ